MINASKEFRKKMKDGANIVNYADITFSDREVLHLTYKDFMIGGCSIEDKTTDGKFGVGFCIGKTLSIKLANHDERFSRYDFYGAIINLYVALLLDNGTVEKLRKGIYYAAVPSTSGDIIEISAVDGMYRLDKDYSSSKTIYPATLQTILTEACLDCGIPIGFRQFDNMGYIVQDRPEKTMYRQVVSWACQIAGYNARIDNDGYMQLIWYNSALLDRYNYDGGNFKTYPHDAVIDGGNFTDYRTNTIISGGDFTDEIPEHIFRIKSLNVSTDDVQITGIRVISEDEKTALFGEEGYLIEVKNPFANGKEQEVANYLGRRMVGMMFRPFTAQVLNNPLYEPFDVVKVSDQKGNVYASILNSISYKVGGYTQVSCIAEDPARNGSMYYSEAAAAVVEARRSAEKQITEYDKAVQQMNQLAGNALGYHTTYEEQPDGSRIVYLHDKPALEDSKTIYKQTIDGFFISTDGGKTYTTGFDSQGNAVVNVLSAIGITFDWAKGGQLTLGGGGNGNGVLRILNNSGTQIGYIDNTGVHFSSGSINLGNLFRVDSSGNLIANSLNSSNANITGGRINIETSDADYSSITLKSGLSSISISPSSLTLRVKGEIGGYSHISKGEIFMKPDNGGEVMIDAHGNNTGSLVSADIILARKMMISSGTKNRIVKTKNFGNVMQYCYETPSPTFGDIGEGRTDKKGLCYIYFDSVFIETVSTDRSYQVFLQKEGEGELWIEEKTQEYFIVKGSPDLKFSWEAKVKQKDYEYNRLDTYDENKNQQKEIDYEKQSFYYLENYEEEILNYEETDKFYGSRNS